MKKLIVKVGAIAATVSLLSATIIPVLADTATNDTTGYNSMNQTSVTNENKVKVENVSDAYIKNEVKTTANTGNNSASYNTMGGMVQTGNATTEVGILNNANINTTLVNLGRDGGSNTAGNSITGAESDNFANILNRNTVNVRNDNTAVLKNEVVAESNTGGNQASYNTDGNGGVVQTGNASTGVGVVNRANDSATSVTGLGDFGSNVVGNSITGYNSMNTAAIQNLNTVRVENVSDAAVFNRAVARALTGGNSASYNTMGGMVQSGNAGVGVDLETDANINTTLVDASMVGFSATSGNSVTGAESENFTNLVNSNNVEVVNRNNKGDSEDADDYCFEFKRGDEIYKKCIKWGVKNIDEDVANTGGNFASNNTFPGAIATGIASVGKYIRVCLNDTLTSIGALLP